MSIKILGDSTSDITVELKNRYGVVTTPMYVNLDSQTMRDGVDITCREMFDWVKKNGIHPKSACPSPEDVAAFLKEHASEGDDLIYVAMSNEISPILNNLGIASRETGIKVYPVDSRVLSTGVAYLMIQAREMADEGLPPEQIVDVLRRNSHRLNVSFVIDTMTYLHRGGRCSSLAALMASALKIKPQILLRDGAMVPAAKFRGNLQRALDQYIALLQPKLDQAVPDRIFITHTVSDRGILDAMRERISSLGRFKEIITVHAGCVIGTHCGPGTLGLIFLDGEV